MGRHRRSSLRVSQVRCFSALSSAITDASTLRCSVSSFVARHVRCILPNHAPLAFARSPSPPPPAPQPGGSELLQQHLGMEITCASLRANLTVFFLLTSCTAPPRAVRCSS